MDNYVTGKIIKELREKKNMTQNDLADILHVSNKAISKWETGNGFPDISIIEPLASALGVSIIELMNGEHIQNVNRAGNVNKLQFYVCPVCGNVVVSLGKGVVSCCGITLPSLISEENDKNHLIEIDSTGDEIFVKMQHEMTKTHYISFVAYVTNDCVEMRKLYPEQNVEVSFMKKGKGYVYAYCNRDGLFRIKF